MDDLIEPEDESRAITPGEFVGVLSRNASIEENAVRIRAQDAQKHKTRVRRSLGHARNPMIHCDDD
jgi:hypothetical protein